jgi:hypothetical protein
MMRLCSVLLVVCTLAVCASLAHAADLKDFDGTWKTTVPKSVTNKSDNLELTVKYDNKGKGSPRFVTPDGDVVFFVGAVTADIFQEKGKDKVVLLREWEVTLSKDKKTMTWNEVDGAAKLEFKKQ